MCYELLRKCTTNKIVSKIKQYKIFNEVNKMKKTRYLNKKAIVGRLSRVIKDQQEARGNLEEVLVDLILGLDEDGTTKQNDESSELKPD